MPRIIERPPLRVVGIAALLALNAGLIMLGRIAISETTPIDTLVPSRYPVPLPLNPPITLTEKTQLSASDDPTLTRPIFFSSRKRFEPQSAQAAPSSVSAVRPTPPDPTLVVDGIVLTSKARRAHLRRPTEAEGSWQEAGQVIDGWTLAEIDRGGIVLEQSGRRFSVRLYPTEPQPFRMERLVSRSRKLR